MKVSRSTGYALVSTAYIAQNSQDGPVMASLISEQYDIPPQYLLKILLQLTKSNVLRGKRGAKGGFSLARPAKDITLLEIIEAIDGPMFSYSQMAEQTNNEPFALKIEKVCDSVNDKAREQYSKAKLSEMIK
jgi:Rrf2 family protein